MSRIMTFFARGALLTACDAGQSPEPHPSAGDLAVQGAALEGAPNDDGDGEGVGLDPNERTGEDEPGLHDPPSEQAVAPEPITVDPTDIDALIAAQRAASPAFAAAMDDDRSLPAGYEDLPMVSPPRASFDGCEQDKITEQPAAREPVAYVAPSFRSNVPLRARLRTIPQRDQVSEEAALAESLGDDAPVARPAVTE